MENYTALTNILDDESNITKKWPTNAGDLVTDSINILFHQIDKADR